MLLIVVLWNTPNILSLTFLPLPELRVTIQLNEVVDRRSLSA